jgi:hypothetical protein
MENTEISSSNDSWRKSPTQYRQYRIHICLVVWNMFYFPWYMGCLPSHWHWYFSESFKPPTRQYCNSDVGLVFLSFLSGAQRRGRTPRWSNNCLSSTTPWRRNSNLIGHRLRAYNVVELHQQLYYHVLPTFGWLGTNRFGVHIPWRYDDETNRLFFQQHTCWFYLKNKWLNQGKTWWGVEACKVS